MLEWRQHPIISGGEVLKDGGWVNAADPGGVIETPWELGAL